MTETEELVAVSLDAILQVLTASVAAKAAGFDKLADAGFAVLPAIQQVLDDLGAWQ